MTAVKMDYLDTIVNVHWGTKANNVAIIQFSYHLDTTSQHKYGATLTSPLLPELGAAQLLSPVPPAYLPPGIQSVPYWSYLPAVKNTTTTATETFTIIDRASYYAQTFTQSGLITSYVNGIGHREVPFVIDNTGNTTPFLDYDILTNAAEVNTRMIVIQTAFPGGSSLPYPVVKEVLASHKVTETQTTYHDHTAAVVFFNLDAIAKASPQAAIFDFDVLAIGCPDTETLTWSAIASVVKSPKMFPVDRDNQFVPPLLPFSTLEIDNKPTFETVMPPSIAHFHIDLTTLLVTGNRQDL